MYISKRGTEIILFICRSFFVSGQEKQFWVNAENRLIMNKWMVCLDCTECDVGDSSRVFLASYFFIIVFTGSLRLDLAFREPRYHHHTDHKTKISSTQACVPSDVAHAVKTTSLSPNETRALAPCVGERSNLRRKISEDPHGWRQ